MHTGLTRLLWPSWLPDGDMSRPQPELFLFPKAQVKGLFDGPQDVVPQKPGIPERPAGPRKVTRPISCYPKVLVKKRWP